MLEQRKLDTYTSIGANGQIYTCCSKIYNWNLILIFNTHVFRFRFFSENFNSPTLNHVNMGGETQTVPKHFDSLQATPCNVRTPPTSRSRESNVSQHHRILNIFRILRSTLTFHPLMTENDLCKNFGTSTCECWRSVLNFV